MLKSLKIIRRVIKLQKNKSTSFIIVVGSFIIIIFIYVIAINLLPKALSSDTYYARTDYEMNAKIESLEIEKEKLIIKTSGEAIAYCVKSTKTNPPINSLCWNNIYNNTASISILPARKYYIWIRDSSGKISNPQSISD